MLSCHFLQHCTGSPIYCNKIRKGNKSHTDLQGRNKTVFVFKSYDLKSKKLKMQKIQ
jgi:hypothetical protein